MILFHVFVCRSIYYLKVKNNVIKFNIFRHVIDHHYLATYLSLQDI
jgi:hypothetical protein